MGRRSKNIKLRIPEKLHKIKGFRSGSYRVATTISSAARYDHFDTLPYHKYAVLGESHMISSAARYDHFDNSPCIYLQHQLKNQPRKKERTDGEISKHTAQSSRH